MSNQRWVVVGVVVALGALISCSGTTPVTSCASDAECGADSECRDGACVARLATGCQAGETRPCGPEPVGACTKGTQRCVNGVFESACTGAVTAKDETCNGVDDDCDGTVDEGAGQTWYADRDQDGHGVASESQVACSAPAGSVASSDDCDDTKANVHPGADEVCSSAAIDEDCDGTVDEGCGCPSVGMTMACCSGRGTQTCEARDGGASYSMCSVSPVAESCNGLDDDCDGQVDEQLAFRTDAGFALADGGLVAADGTCTAGVGACRQSATAACAQGAITCSATPGSPATEVCNNIDDDCDGQTDEGTQVTCYPDEDGDGAASSATSSSQCPDPSRAAFGNCPVGFVAVVPPDFDCAPNDPTLYTPVVTRADVDGDTYCFGSGTYDCIGTSVASGRRLLSECSATDDCNEQNATTWRLQLTRANADGDAYCVGAATSDCIGTNPPAGRTLATSCAADDDCDDTATGSTRLTCYPDEDNDQFRSATTVSSLCRDATRLAWGYCPSGYSALIWSELDCAPLDASAWAVGQSRVDVDGDSFCVGAPITQCQGSVRRPGQQFANGCAATDDCNDSNANLTTMRAVRTDADGDAYCDGPVMNACQPTAFPAGVVRLASSCLGDDCSDSNAAIYRAVSLRSDADNDSFCAGAPATTCIGATLPTGKRVTSSCQGEDCRDTNVYATSSCSFTGEVTTEATKQCGIGYPASQDFYQGSTNPCPTGFSAIDTVATITGGDPGGTCQALSINGFRATCGALVFGSFRCRNSSTCVAQ